MFPELTPASLKMDGAAEGSICSADYISHCNIICYIAKIWFIVIYVISVAVLPISLKSSVRCTALLIMIIVEAFIIKP